MLALLMERFTASMQVPLIPQRVEQQLLLLLLSFCRKNIMFIFWVLEQKNRKSNCRS